MARERLLIVDDEPNARSALRLLLSEDGHPVTEAADGAEALEKLRLDPPDLVLCDVRMPRLDGISLLQRARAEGIDSAFVMMTAYATISMAVEAMRAGADHFLTKPLDLEAAQVVLEKVLSTRRLMREAEGLRERVRERFRLESIVGESPELQGVLAMVRQAAPTRAAVLVLGEAGTGKELVAQALHESSPRREGPFVKVDCGAGSEANLELELFGVEAGGAPGVTARRAGKLEAAHGGTLFLDDIGALPVGLQARVLSVLQGRGHQRVGGGETLPSDFRVVAATHRDLQDEVKHGRFREDLFYALGVVAVRLPPLRQRKNDLPLLVSRFLEKHGRQHGKTVTGLAPGTLNALMAHDWPGNVRELENAVERAVVLCQGNELVADDLPPALRGPRPRALDPKSLIPGASMAEIEREAILRTLEMVDGSTQRAADVLGISIRTIQYRLKEYGVDRKQLATEATKTKGQA